LGRDARLNGKLRDEQVQGRKASRQEVATRLSTLISYRALGFSVTSAAIPSAGRNTNVFDFALMRDVPIHESLGLQFRWEVSNLTNTTQFGQPNNNLSSSGVSQITTLAGDPRVMQFALRLSF